MRMLRQAAAVHRMIAGAFGVRRILLHCASMMRRFDTEQPGCAHRCLHRHDKEQDPQNQAVNGTHTSILANRRGDHMRSGTASQQKGSRRPEGFGQTQPRPRTQQSREAAIAVVSCSTGDFVTRDRRICAPLAATVRME